MTVIYYMSIDRADKPWIGDRRLTEGYTGYWIVHANLLGDRCQEESFRKMKECTLRAYWELLIVTQNRG